MKILYIIVICIALYIIYKACIEDRDYFDPTTVTQKPIYIARPFVQYTSFDTDLPNQPIGGTLSQCEDACTQAVNCLGFTRRINAPDGSISSCWLKQKFTAPTFNDLTHHTYVPSTAIFPVAPTTPTTSTTTATTIPVTTTPNTITFGSIPAITPSTGPPPTTVQKPIYIARPFVQFTSPGTDLPNQPIRATLRVCEDACTQDVNCLGFSREINKPNETMNSCWLKQKFINPTFNNSEYHTYMPSTAVFPVAPTTTPATATPTATTTTAATPAAKPCTIL